MYMTYWHRRRFIKSSVNYVVLTNRSEVNLTFVVGDGRSYNAKMVTNAHMCRIYHRFSVDEHGNVWTIF